MHKRRVAALLTALCCFAALTFPAYAGIEEVHAKALAEASAKMEQALEPLRAVPEAEWREEDVQQYLGAALLVVFYAEQVEADRAGGLPLDPLDIVHHVVITSMPPNPFNGFAPMRFVAPEDFSPGDLVIQVAPREYWSGLLNPEPRTFMLSVLGRSRVDAPGHPLDYSRFPWASEPTGCLYTNVAYRPGSAERLELLRKAEESKGS